MSRSIAGFKLRQQSIQRTRSMIYLLRVEDESVLPYVHAKNRAPAIATEEAILQRLQSVGKRG